MKSKITLVVITLLAVFGVQAKSNNAGGVNAANDEISALQDGLAEVASGVAEVRAAAQANADAIAANTAGIGSNGNDIANNASDISGNASGIATNASGISGNSSGIGINAAGISGNSTDIGTNAAAIAGNSEGIGANAAAIDGNASAINALDEAVRELLEQVAALQSGITALTADINTLHEDVLVESKARSASDSDILDLIASYHESSAMTVLAQKEEIDLDKGTIAPNDGLFEPPMDLIATSSRLIASNVYVAIYTTQDYDYADIDYATAKEIAYAQKPVTEAAPGKGLVHIVYTDVGVAKIGNLTCDDGVSAAESEAKEEAKVVEAAVKKEAQKVEEAEKQQEALAKPALEPLKPAPTETCANTSSLSFNYEKLR